MIPTYSWNWLCNSLCYWKSKEYKSFYSQNCQNWQIEKEMIEGRWKEIPFWWAEIFFFKLTSTYWTFLQHINQCVRLIFSFSTSSHYLLIFCLIFYSWWQLSCINFPAKQKNKNKLYIGLLFHGHCNKKTRKYQSHTASKAWLVSWIPRSIIHGHR